MYSSFAKPLERCPLDRGCEEFGEVDIPYGTGFAVGGAGTRRVVNDSTIINFSVNVPNKPTVFIKQVIAYYGGRDRESSRRRLNCRQIDEKVFVPIDYDNIIINGVEVEGHSFACKRGGRFLNRTSKADITSYGLVFKGLNNFNVQYKHISRAKYDGVGIVVIYEDTDDPKTYLRLFEGNDYSFDRAPLGPIDTYLTPVGNDSHLDGFAFIANVEHNRSMYFELSTDSQTAFVQNPAGSYEGAEYDIVAIDNQTSNPEEPLFPILNLTPSDMKVSFEIEPGHHPDYIGRHRGWQSSFYLNVLGLRFYNAEGYKRSTFPMLVQ